MKVNNKTLVISENGTNADIVRGIESFFPLALKQVKEKNWCEFFRAATIEQTAENVWDYLKFRINYKADGNTQRIKTPARLVFDAKNDVFGFSDTSKADCKSYALFAAACMKALYPKANVCFRYVSFKKADATPTHVYCVVKQSGQTIIIDGVYDEFNHEKPYKHKQDHQAMRIVAMTGFDETGKTALVNARNRYPYGHPYREQLNNAINGMGGTGIGNTENITGAVGIIARRSELTQQQKQQGVTWIMTNKNNNVNGSKLHLYGSWDIALFAARQIGAPQSVIDYIMQKGAEAVPEFEQGLNPLVQTFQLVAGVVPRNAFLKLLTLNFGGYASRLKLAMQREPNKVRAWWTAGGGNFASLVTNINKGAGKRPILAGQAGQDAAALTGIGAVETIAALLGAAATVIISVTQLLKQIGVGENEGLTNPLTVDPNAPLPSGSGGSVMEQVDTFLNNIIGPTGTIPIDLPQPVKYGIALAGLYGIGRVTGIVPKLF